MLKARFYVTSPDNSPPNSLMDHPTVVTELPFELVGMFLTVDIDRSRHGLFRELPSKLAKVADGRLPKYDGGGEGHQMTATKSGVRIETNFAEPQMTVEVPLDDFRELLDRWREFVRKHERDKQSAHLKNKTIRQILDFVEGRLSAKEFEQLLHTDAELERELRDESLSWRNTHIKTDPYDFVIWLNFDDPAGRLNAHGAMEYFLERRGVSFKSDRTAAKAYDLLLEAHPKWLSLDTAYLRKYVLPDAGDKQGPELKNWLRARLLELFRFHKKPPKWIQSPAWPIADGRPLYFLGQIKLENCEHFHDEAVAYLFFDPASGQTETVFQVN
jgi:hypothetical protein